MEHIFLGELLSYWRVIVRQGQHEMKLLFYFTGGH